MTAIAEEDYAHQCGLGRYHLGKGLDGKTICSDVRPDTKRMWSLVLRREPRGEIQVIRDMDFSVCYTMMRQALELPLDKAAWERDCAALTSLVQAIRTAAADYFERNPGEDFYRDEAGNSMWRSGGVSTRGRWRSEWYSAAMIV